MWREGENIQTSGQMTNGQNGLADRLAGRAWEEAFSQVQNQANAPRFRHAGGIQVITSEGSIAGQIPKQLPELLMTERKFPAL